MKVKNSPGGAINLYSVILWIIISIYPMYTDCNIFMCL